MTYYDVLLALPWHGLSGGVLVVGFVASFPGGGALFVSSRRGRFGRPCWVRNKREAATFAIIKSAKTFSLFFPDLDLAISCLF